VPAVASTGLSLAAAAVKREALPPSPNPYTADTTVYVREEMDIETQ
jgi:hypothetical protein